MRRLLALVLGVLTLLCAPAHAQTVTPLTLGNSIEYTDVTANPKLYIPATRSWFSDNQGTPVNWNFVETASGTFNWFHLDAVMALAQARNVQMIYTFGMTPTWCNGGNTADVPCTSETDYHNYVAAVVGRYPGQIKYYEPLNEVNLPGAPTAGWWSGTQAQVLTYAADVYTTIHAADPNALVLSPSVEGQSSNGAVPGGAAYMQALLAAGLGSDFDVYNWHGYAWNSFPGQYPEQTAYICSAMKQLANMYGQGGKPFFVDEGGYQPSLPSSLQAPYTAIYNLLLTACGAAQIDWFQFDNGNGFGVLSDGAAFLNPAGISYRVTQGELIGATWTIPPARAAGTNLIRNPTSTGAAAGTPGTVPTDWGIFAPDRTHGITDQVVGTCTDGTRSGIDWKVAGTVTSGASGQADLFFETGTQIATTTGAQRQVGAYVRLDAGTTANTVVSLNENENNSSGTFLASDMDWVFNPVNDTLANDQITYFGRASQATAAFEQPYLQIAYPTTVGTVVNIELCVAAPSDDNGTDWTGRITKPGGYQADFVWDSHGDVAPSTFTVPTGQGYTTYRDITGQTYPLGTTVQITNAPILLENTQWKPLILENTLRPVNDNEPLKFARTG